MANPYHVDMLKFGSTIWNARRLEYPIRPDLRGAELSHTNLSWMDLTEADLREANLVKADLRWAHLNDADLRGANLHQAHLGAADLTHANLDGADLTQAHMEQTTGLNVQGARLTEVALRRPTPLSGRPRRVLLAVTESDCHVVVNKLLEWHFIRRHGCEVRNLGGCTPAQEIAEAAREFEPDAIVLSSQNGHAFADLASLPAAMEAAGVTGVPVYLGGNLSVGADKQLDDPTQRFRALGIQVVQSFDHMDRLLLNA